MEKFAEIEKYEDRLLKAIRENNVKELEILLHDDLVFLNPMGQVLTKDMDLENYKSGQIAIETLQPSEQRVSLIGDTAVITVKIRLKGKGFPVYKKEGEFGDLYVTYQIKLPRNLTEKQKALFTELSKS